MANQLYGSNTYGYAAASNPASIFTSRSVVDQYVPADPAYLSSSRYYGTDPLSSASNLYSYSSISDRGPSMLYNHTDTIAAGYTAAGGSTGWPGPPGVEVDVNAATVDPMYAGLKRSSTEGIIILIVYVQCF